MSPKRKQRVLRKSGKQAGPASAPARPGAEDLIAAIPETDLPELFRFWAGARGGTPPADPDLQRCKVLRWMQDPATVEDRIYGLGRRLLQILDLHLDAPGHQVSLEELAGHRDLAYLSAHELEAGIMLLKRKALLAERRDGRFKGDGGRAFAMPEDVAQGVLNLRRERKRGVFHALSLRGYLDRLYFSGNEGKQRTPATRVRELYKMYANDGAAVARIDRLPTPLRTVVEKAILQFGGILPRSLFERTKTGVEAWGGSRWGGQLRESLVGSVERLELARFGIRHNDETLIIFNEVALAWLRRVAVPGDPDSPHREASLGVDLASNISRFIAFILEHNVRFTVRGQIFKTTEKRILQELIPNPGRELQRSEVLAFIYGFARQHRLIESTGERTFALTVQGRAWERQNLDAKLQNLVDYAVEDGELGGDPYHQVSLRRIFLRLLKRVEPETWYDLMYLPFLARNTYLANLEEQEVDAYFSAQAPGGQYTPMEDVQRLAWSLAKWVRRRMYLLGLVDIGYDSAYRPVALRLTRMGARFLGILDEAPAAGPGLGSLVVTPNFEVVMFPGGDDAELVHEIDRYCERAKASNPVHFRISERSVQRGLAEGVHLSRMLETLTRHSRTPLPQNISFSIRDWAHRAGLMRLSADGVLRCECAETLKRFCQDPAARVHLREQIDEQRVQLKGRYSVRRLQSLLRELHYLVELET